MAGSSGKSRRESMETRRVRIEYAIIEGETSTALVLLKESAIPEASLAGRKPAELGKGNLLFWHRFKRDREKHSS